MRTFWRLVWNTSERTGIGLGRFAPYVFGKMMGSVPEEVDHLGNKL